MILGAKELAAARRATVMEAAARLVEERGVRPTLAMVRAGESPALLSHAKSVRRSFERAGFGFAEHALPEEATTEEMKALLADLAADPETHGILIQEPLPKGVDGAALLLALDPAMDVDGVHPLNAGLLQQGRKPYHIASTPLGGMAILDHFGVELKGKRAVVVGRSDIVGKPMAMLLLHRHATVTIAHSRTTDLAAVTRDADIICAAVGRAGLIRAEHVRPGATVIDFGINEVDGKLVGDVAFDEVAEIASVTPTPGGTGPITAVILLENTLAAARYRLDGAAGVGEPM